MWNFSFLIIFVIVIYKIFLRKMDEHCDGSLLKRGTFVNDTKWVPDGGCEMQNYSNRDTRNCFMKLSDGRPSSIHLIGDSRIRILHDSIIDGINGSPMKYKGIHTDRSYSDKKLNLDINFYWHPGPSSEIKNTLFDKWKKGNRKSLIIVMGTVLHTIKNYASVSNISYGYQIFKENLTALVPSFQDLTSTTDVLWFDQPYAVNWTHVEKHIELIDMFNLGSKIILSKTNVKIWSSAKMIIELKPEMYKDRVHPKREIYDTYYRQILFNFMCNKLDPLPNNLCCNSSSESVDKFQRNIIAAGVGIVILFLVWVFRKRKKCHLNERECQFNTNVIKECGNDITMDKNFTNQLSVEELIIQSVKFIFVMFFIYVCEKEQLLGIEEKFKFSASKFFMTLLIFLVPTVLTFKKTRSEGTQFNDLTNEMKGWMQLVLFTYHMMSVDSSIPVNMITKQLISSYLFIIGNSLFTHYWNGGDMRFNRYIQVVFGMNFFTVVLCLVLGQSFQFYYLVPLITFWYSIAFLILAVPPSFHLPDGAQPRKNDYIIVILRLVVLVAFSLSLSWSQFPVWRFLFHTDETVDREWNERCYLNKFSLPYGMIFALIYNFINQHVKSLKKFTPTIKRNILFGSLGCTLLYLYYVLLINHIQENEFNHIHPFVIWLPILGYSLLRISTRTLASCHSAFLAYVGEMYIEFFIFQHHILLTNNAQNLLVIVPESSLVNIAATTLFLFTVSHDLHNINLFLTHRLTIVI